MARLGRGHRQSGFRGTPGLGTGGTPLSGRLVGPQAPQATTQIPLPRPDQRTIVARLTAVATRRGWPRRFPRQGWDGGATSDTSPQHKPVVMLGRFLGPQPPAAVLPLPSQQAQTIAVRLVAVQTRQSMRRRFPAQGMEPTMLGGFERALGPAPPEAVLPLPNLRAQTVAVVLVAVRAARRRAGMRFVSQLARPAAPIVNADVVTGTASPSGSVVEAWSVLTLAQMTVRTRLVAVRVARLRRQVAYRSRLGRGPAITVTTDTPTGTAAPTGTLAAEQKTYTDAPTGSAAPSGAATDAFSVVGLAQMTIRVRRAADLVTRRVRIRYQHRLTLVPGIRYLVDAPTGTAAASGGLADARIGHDSPTGTASPSGSVVEQWTHGTLYTDNPAGQAAPTGSCTDDWTPPPAPSPGGGAGGGDNSDPSWTPQRLVVEERRRRRELEPEPDPDDARRREEDELLVLGLL